MGDMYFLTVRRSINSPTRIRSEPFVLQQIASKVYLSTSFVLEEVVAERVCTLISLVSSENATIHFLFGERFAAGH